MDMIHWLANLLTKPDVSRSAELDRAVEIALRDADRFLTERLAACGWREADVPRDTRTLIQGAVHEANRLCQPVATTAHVIVAAVRFEEPAVPHLVSGQTTSRKVLIALRETVSRLIPEELEIPVSPDLSAELMSHLKVTGPADPNAIVTAILADAECEAATMLCDYATRSAG